MTENNYKIQTMSSEMGKINYCPQMVNSITDLRRIISLADIASVDEWEFQRPLELSRVLCNVMGNLKLPLTILIFGVSESCTATTWS